MPLGTHSALTRAKKTHFLLDCVSLTQYVHFCWFCSDCPRGQMQKEVGLVRRELREANPCWWERNAWWSRSGGKERLVSCGAGVVGKHTRQAELLGRTIWNQAHFLSSHPSCEFITVTCASRHTWCPYLCKRMGRTIWKMEKRWKTGGAGTTRA